jgi:hypothetical protein
MKTRGLRQAHKLFRAGKYPDVIRVLEPQIFLYREDAGFYYLLGLSCLLSGDPAGAYSYLSRSSHINAESIETLLALAATQVRRRRDDEALQLWLQVLEFDPRNRIARRGLAMLREADSPAVVHEATEGDRIKRFLPTRRVVVPRGLWIASAAILLTVLVVLSSPRLIPLIRARDVAGADPRDGVELTRIDEDLGELTEFQGQFRYILTESEIRDRFRLMGEYFNTFRDNMAMREINRILNSNAASELKQRAALLSNYIRPPTFITFRDNATFAEIAREPWLYDGSYVRWTGRISNLVESDDSIRFDLLVGYETERILEGVAPVELTFAVRLSPGMSVEVIGKVVAENRLQSIEGTSIRMIAPGQETVQN